MVIVPYYMILKIFEGTQSSHHTKQSVNYLVSNAFIQLISICEFFSLCGVVSHYRSFVLNMLFFFSIHYKIQKLTIFWSTVSKITHDLHLVAHPIRDSAIQSAEHHWGGSTTLKS